MLVCCLPVGFAAGTALASVSLVVGEHRGWFVVASFALLALGFVQLRRGQRACARKRTLPAVVFLLSTTVVLLVVFFPQVVASLMADWLP
jgi:uncharacterized membrane protein YidH (DUF202 family)